MFPKKNYWWSPGIVALLCVILGLAQMVEAGAPPAARDKTYEGITIRWIGEAVPPTYSLEKLVPEFERMTGIKVVIEMVECEAVWKKTKMDCASKTGTYDAFSLDYAFLGGFSEMGYIQSIEKFMQDPNLRDPDMDVDDLIRAQWEATSWWKGACYGFPSNSCIMFLWYRKDLLENPAEKAAFKEEYGYPLEVPVNWLQYRDIAEFFTRPEQGLYGVALNGKRGIGLTCEWMDYMWSFGGDVLNKQGNPVINSPDNIEALKFYVSLFRYAPPGAKEYAYDTVTTAFMEEKTVLAVQWNDQAFDVESAESKVAGKMGYGAIPIKKMPAAHLGSWTHAIPTYSKHPEAAYLFIQWATSRDVQIKLAREGMVPCRYSSFDDPEVRKIPFFYPATVDAAGISNFRPRIPEWPEMESYMRIALQDGIYGKKTPKDALDWLQQKYEELLKK